MAEMCTTYWLKVAITVLSGAASAALADRRNASDASNRVADRLAGIAVVGSRTTIVLLDPL